MGTVITLNRPAPNRIATGDRKKASLTIHAVLSYLLQNAQEAGLTDTADAISAALCRAELEMEPE
jgi:Holliday junction resolvasome RuvABC endonuclease subunit